MIVAGPMFGPSLDFPTLVQELSPFTHSPKLPAVGVTAAPLLGLTAVSSGLALAGLAVLRRRNLVLPA
jgi:ABC-2 type transport system permease protein